MVVAPKPFQAWLPISPLFGQVEFGEAATAELLTRTIRRYADIPEKGRELFQGNLRQRNALYREFRGYVLQAVRYFEVASKIEGSSAALPLYYFGLQLAKAELLRTNASQIVGKRIGHGLSYNPSSSRTMASDSVTVTDGVFPLLYEKRTGLKIAKGTKLPIRLVVGNIPEIGWEQAELGMGDFNVGPLLHAVVGDQAESWSLIATQVGHLLSRNDETGRRFRRHYEEVTSPNPSILGPFAQPSASTWRDTFAVTTRHMSGGFRFFQGRWTHPMTYDSGMAILPAGWIQIEATTRLKNLVQEARDESADAEVAGSLYRSKWLPMPSALSRYVVIFYLSSVVRYRPSGIDLRTSPTGAWLADAISEQSPLWMLRDFLSGISGFPHYFRSPGSLRT